MSVVDIVMPKMGATMTSGTIEAWCVQPGDTVAAGSVLCEITTDKVTIDVESEYDGTIVALVTSQGQTVDVGSTIARLSTRSASGQ